MDVSCPACAAKYTADDEKLRGKKARMRCKACNTAWLVTGPGAATDASPVSIPPPAAILETPVSTEARRAAIVRNGAEREKRDLFAEREPEVGSVKETPPASVAPPSSKIKDTLLPPPSFGFTGTAARNENSVLFRVDQLSGLGRINTPSPERIEIRQSKHHFGGDEEGVIDLKQLASVPPPGHRSIIPVAPLFSEPPPMMLDVHSTGSRPAMQKPLGTGKIVAIIAAAAMFLIIGGLGLSLAFKGEEAVSRTAAVISTPPPAPTPTVTAAPSVAPATSVASEEETPKKGKKGKRSKGAKGASSPGAPAKVKPADPCGCHGDFNCIMACTVKNGH